MARNFSYFTKLFITFLITGVIPMALVSTIFAFLSGDIMKGSYRQQAGTAIRRIGEDLDGQLDRLRHTIYQLSGDGLILSSLEGNREPDRSELLPLYQKMYQSLTGNIDNASLHIISLTAFPSVSTQQIPPSYPGAGSEAAEGLFALARGRPERTFARFNSFVNSRGDGVMMTFCKAITGGEGDLLGFIVLDINKNFLAETAERGNDDFFTQLLIVDPLNNLMVDLNHDEKDGNFSGMPELALIPADSPGLVTRENRMIAHHPLALSPFQVAGAVPMNVVLSNLAYLIRITLWMFLFCLLLAVTLAYLISRSISRPVHRLSLAMERVESGDLAVRLEADRGDEIGLLFKRFNMMTGRIANLVEETREEQRQLRIAERQALQAQINPHFLYNTLNTIKSLAKLGEVAQIATVATEFGRLLRNSIDNGREMVTLRESLDLVESYLVIQKIRYGDRLSFTIRSEEALDRVPVPKLIIQPLVENAVIHGIEGRIEPGSIGVTVGSRENRIAIEILDDGPGFGSAGKGEDRGESCGVGLENIRRRLMLIYGEAGEMTLGNRNDGPGARVLITLPLTEGEIS